MSESVKDFSFQEHNIRQNSLGFGALAVHGEVVQYTVAPKSLFLDGAKVTRYDDEMVLVASDVPTRPVSGKSGSQTQTEVIRDFIVSEHILDGKFDVVRHTSLSLEGAYDQADEQTVRLTRAA